MTTSTERDDGLRERKKRRTRESIEAAALRLFAERGFGATTIADIAAAADISPRTFFGYFPSKEAVLYADADDTFRAFEAEMARPRPAGFTAIDVLRTWIREWFTEHPPDSAKEQLVHRLKQTEPSVVAQELQLMARFEQAIAAALATDLGLEPHDVRARMVAAAAVASLRALEPLDDACEVPPDKLDPEALAVLDDALRFLRSGLDAFLPPAQ